MIPTRNSFSYLNVNTQYKIQKRLFLEATRRNKLNITERFLNLYNCCCPSVEFSFASLILICSEISFTATSLNVFIKKKTISRKVSFHKSTATFTILQYNTPSPQIYGWLTSLLTVTSASIKTSLTALVHNIYSNTWYGSHSWVEIYFLWTEMQ